MAPLVLPMAEMSISSMRDSTSLLPCSSRMPSRVIAAVGRVVGDECHKSASANGGSAKEPLASSSEGRSARGVVAT
eukprot:1266798-Pleurochrysis_carterae.AAC.1